MNNKTIWVNFGDYGNTYKITVKNSQKLIQPHRINKGIDFLANRYAIEMLSPHAYMLYMYLLLNSVNCAWALSEDQVAKNTQLTADDLEWTVQELIDKKYLTAGEIDVVGKHYKKNCYHLWEEPSLNPEYKTK